MPFGKQEAQSHMKERPYTKPGRLSDVLALIQVLAFDPDTHRSDLGIINKELGPPSSTRDASWLTLAKEHRELFRVSEKAEHALSLVARHVQPSDPTRSENHSRRSLRTFSLRQPLSCMIGKWRQLRDGNISYLSGRCCLELF